MEQFSNWEDPDVVETYTDAQFSPSGNKIVVEDSSQSGKIFNADNGSYITSLQGGIFSKVHWNKQEDTIVGIDNAGVLCIWNAFTGKRKETAIKIGFTHYKIKFDATDKNFFVVAPDLSKALRPAPLFFAMLDSDGHCLAHHEIAGEGALHFNPDATLFITATNRPQSVGIFADIFRSKNPTFAECVDVLNNDYQKNKEKNT